MNFGSFLLMLDGLGKRVGSIGAERAIDFAKQLAIEGVKLGVVGGAMVGAEPPTPVAPFGGKQRVKGRGKFYDETGVIRDVIAQDERPK